MLRVERVRLVNPQKRKASKKRRAAKKTRAGARRHKRARNPVAELLSLGFTNPSRRNAMAKAKRNRKKGGFKARHTTRRHKNPFGKMRHSRRRRNPGMLSGATSILKSGFYALLGLVVARQLPQLILGTSNQSWMGYLANIATTFVAAMFGGKLLGREAGRDIALGGGLYVVNRVIQDNFSPVGKVLSISGLGDYGALGDITPGYFPLPVPTDANGQPIIPNEIRPMMPAPSGMKGLGSVASHTRYASRF